MSEITVAGETFNVRLEGDETKEVLALAHHLGGSLELWEPLMPALLEHFRVLRYDSRGHGASVANEGPYSVAKLAQDAIGILDALRIEKAHWLGLSMGAIVGQAVLLQAPDRIGRAVLANTAAQIGAPEIWNARILAARSLGMDHLAQSTAERWFTEDFRAAEPDLVRFVIDIFRATPAVGYAAACAALRDVDQRETVRSIRNKVLVLVGRHDPSAPASLGAFVASVIEGAKLVTLESSHISAIEDQEGFMEAAVDFLTAVDSPLRKVAPPRKIARRTPARQGLASRAPAKKAVAKKAPPKKAATKKAAPKKAAAQKAAVKKAPAKKAVVKKSTAKKAPAKKSAVKKAAPKKVPVNKAAAKKAAAKKVAAKKVAAKKGAVKKAPVRTAPAKSAPSKSVAKKGRATAAKAVQKKAVQKKAALKKPRRGR